MNDPPPAMIIDNVTTAGIVINARVWVEPKHFFAGAAAVRQAVLDAFKANKVPLAVLPGIRIRTSGGGGGGAGGGARDAGLDDAEVMAMASTMNA